MSFFGAVVPPWLQILSLCLFGFLVVNCLKEIVLVAHVFVVLSYTVTKDGSEYIIQATESFNLHNKLGVQVK